VVSSPLFDGGSAQLSGTLTVTGRTVLNGQLVADAGICLNPSCSMSITRPDDDSVFFTGDGNDAFKVGTQASFALNSTNFWAMNGGGTGVGPTLRALGEGNVDARLVPAGGDTSQGDVAPLNPDGTVDDPGMIQRLIDTLGGLF
jgi:hypothetical protein